MGPDKKKISAECFRKGNEAMVKHNWDYAIDMYRKAAMMVPENLLYRQTLRGCEKKKYDGNGTGAKMASVKLIGIRGKIKKAKSKKDWNAVDLAAEEGLAVNPWDSQLNADLGAACREREFGEVALFAYQTAVEADGNNKDLLTSLAELYEERAEYNDAVKCWDQVRKIDPLDGNARMQINRLEAAKTLDRGGYDEAETTKGVMADHEIAKRLGVKKPGQEIADGPGMSEEADLQRAIRKEPEEKDNYMKLGDFYRRSGKLEEAAEQFQKALDISGGDPSIREQLEDLELDQMRHTLDIAKAASSKDPDDETSKKNRISLANELLRREIEVFRTRVERYPNDMKLKLELGHRFVNAKQPDQAIPMFQQSVADQRIAPQALVALGKCFIRVNKGVLARRQLEKAKDLLDAREQTKQFLDCHYWLGRLCEEAGDTEDAEAHYGEVLALDYEYKDALKRLEDLQGD